MMMMAEAVIGIVFGTGVWWQFESLSNFNCANCEIEPTAGRYIHWLDFRWKKNSQPQSDDDQGEEWETDKDDI